MSDVGNAATQGESFSRKFLLLLERFPRLDGEQWQNAELERESHKRETDPAKQLSESYLSQLKNDRIKKPGYEKLKTIADIVGFPVELWYLQPERWDEELANQRASRGPGRRVPEGAELAALIDHVLEVRTNKRTGKPYTAKEIEEESRGRVTAQEFEQMRQGNAFTTPVEKLLRLSDVVDVPYGYWFSGALGRGLLDSAGEEALKEALEDNLLLAAAMSDLPENDRRQVRDRMMLLIEAMRATGGGTDDHGEAHQV